MRKVNIHQAKTQLSRLVDEASKGAPFIIAKTGKPLVKVLPLEPIEAGKSQRLGFLDGEFSIPEDFDQVGREEIRRLFGQTH